MTLPEEISFDRYLDTIFAASNRLDACVNMLSAFLESIDSCRDDLRERLPGMAPSIVDQVVAVVDRAQRLERRLRTVAQTRGPEFQTSELGAVLWWAGMASHKAMAAAEAARGKMAREVWDDAFFEVHALMYDTMSALSLLSLAEAMIQRMERESIGRYNPN